MRCPRCEAEVPNDVCFCTECGSVVPLASETTPMQSVHDVNQQELPRNKKAIYARIMVGVVLIAVVVAALVAFAVANNVVSATETVEEEVVSESDSKEAAMQDSESAVDAGATNKDRGSSAIGFVGFSSVRASSTLATGGVNTASYSAVNLIDDNASTCWCEGATGNGIGESVTFSSDRPQVITGMTVWNGYQKDDYHYDINSRVRLLDVYADKRFIGTFKLDDSGLVSRKIVFDEPIEASSIMVEISDVYQGSKYDDCCISEMSFY